MKSILLSISIFTVACLNAQPVMQYTNYVAAGVTGTVFAGAKPSSPGAAGAGVTWDFSTISFTNVATVSVVQPSATTYSASFPGANWAAVINSTIIPTTFLYNNVQPGYAEQLGNNITAAGGQTYTPDPKKDLVFPMNYGDSFTDSYQCVSCSPSSVTRTYDGYGTLIINGKTYYNVARVASNFGNYYYNYYNMNPLYSIFAFDTSPSASGSSYFEVIGSTGIKEESLLSNMQLYPNPAPGYFEVKNNNFQEVKLQVIDLSGRVLVSGLSIKPGQTFSSKSCELKSGLYTLVFTDDFGNISHAKQVIN